MPKKTKRQKILAQLHRKLTKISTSSLKVEEKPELVKRQNHDVQSNISTITNPAFVYKKDSLTKPKTMIVSSDCSYVIHDLIKITIFTLLAFAFQAVLYFLLNRK